MDADPRLTTQVSNENRASCYRDGLRIAIFGGTFDPVHEAHLAVARAARDEFELDRVLLIPAAAPPHKLHLAPAPWLHRYRMVQLACEGERNLEASDLEAGAEKSYSILTIEKLLATLPPGDQLFFIIGADAFAEIRLWHRFEDVLRAVDFIVVTRPGHEWPVVENARTHRLGVELPISSSAIRQSLARGERPDGLPGPVLSYIQQHELYRA